MAFGNEVDDILRKAFLVSTFTDEEIDAMRPASFSVAGLQGRGAGMEGNFGLNPNEMLAQTSPPRWMQEPPPGYKGYFQIPTPEGILNVPLHSG